MTGFCVLPSNIDFLPEFNSCPESFQVECSEPFADVEGDRFLDGLCGDNLGCLNDDAQENDIGHLLVLQFLYRNLRCSNTPLLNV